VANGIEKSFCSRMKAFLVDKKRKNAGETDEKKVALTVVRACEVDGLMWRKSKLSVAPLPAVGLTLS